MPPLDNLRIEANVALELFIVNELVEPVRSIVRLELPMVADELPLTETAATAPLTVIILVPEGLTPPVNVRSFNTVISPASVVTGAIPPEANVKLYALLPLGVNVRPPMVACNLRVPLLWVNVLAANVVAPLVLSVPLGAVNVEHVARSMPPVKVTAYEGLLLPVNVPAFWSKAPVQFIV